MPTLADAITLADSLSAMLKSLSPVPPLPPSPPSPRGKTKGSVIPLYTYPTDGTFDTLAKLARQSPNADIIAVINPDSGVGEAFSQDYADGIKKLKDAGVWVVGYISTNYGNRLSNDVIAEISQYYNRYPAINGIFFDEVPNSGNTMKYRVFSDTVKKRGGITIGNAGTDMPESWKDIFTIALIYEEKGLPVMSGSHSQKVGIIPYGVDAVKASQIVEMFGSVDYIYIQDDDLPNPWDTLSKWTVPVLTVANQF